MKREFNITGTCSKEEHYMVDTSAKIVQVLALIEKGKYFTINRPRQYGKTTTLALIEKELQKDEQYLIINTSFAGIENIEKLNNQGFARLFLLKIARYFRFRNPDFYKFLRTNAKELLDMEDLSDIITDFVHKVQKRIVLLIDEVDASCEYDAFLTFLGTLRDKYIERDTPENATFHSVVFIGLHDVREIAYKFHEGKPISKDNSWDIAVDFDIEMGFCLKEVETMLESYCEAENITMNVPIIAEKIYGYTSGYPYFVSRLCKDMAEKILPKKKRKIGLQQM